MKNNLILISGILAIISLAALLFALLNDYIYVDFVVWTYVIMVFLAYIAIVDIREWSVSRKNSYRSNNALRA
jgi:hypothetical protein